MPIKPEDWQKPDISTLKSITLNFLKELRDASAGKKSSLPFIYNNIPSLPLVGENEIFQVMVAGGSVFKKAEATKKNGGIFFSKKEEVILPTFKTSSDFISFIDFNLDLRARVVALNFAYPLGPILRDGRMDGTLIEGAKEHTFTGLVGKKVGLELERHFLKKYNRKIIFTVANDAVCLLLSGPADMPREKLAGGIVGTGVNFSFFIDTKTAVNLEARNFNKFPISKEGLEISLDSKSPGVGLFGKETSGAYLYQHFNSIIKKRNISHSPISTTEELNRIAMNDDGTAGALARGLFKRSAGLVACQIAGITLFKDHDMTFVMEGSLFWKADRYKEMVEGYVKQLAPDFKVNFVFIEDGHFLGAARLAC